MLGAGAQRAIPVSPQFGYSEGVSQASMCILWWGLTRVEQWLLRWHNQTPVPSLERVPSPYQLWRMPRAKCTKLTRQSGLLSREPYLMDRPGEGHPLLSFCSICFRIRSGVTVESFAF